VGVPVPVAGTRSTRKPLLRPGFTKFSAMNIVLPTQLSATIPPRTASVIQNQRRERFFDCCDYPELGVGETPYGGCLYGGEGCCPHWGCCTGIGGCCHWCCVYCGYGSGGSCIVYPLTTYHHILSICCDTKYNTSNDGQ
jgi:hypothetical protein